MSARKKAPVNLLMCPFELYMFIGVSMQLRAVFKYFLSHTVGQLPLKKQKNKKNFFFSCLGTWLRAGLHGGEAAHAQYGLCARITERLPKI